MRSASRSLAWILFSVFALVAISFFFIPAFIIRPFTHQSPEGLHVAMALRQRAPVVTLTAALLSLSMGIALWFAVGRWRKAVLVVIMLVVAFSAVMSRLNYFEWMFHPVDGARVRGRLCYQTRQGRNDSRRPLRPTMPAPTPSARWLTITCSTTRSPACPVAVTY
jgi:hypothetical protein